MLSLYLYAGSLYRIATLGLLVYGAVFFLWSLIDLTKPGQSEGSIKSNANFVWICFGLVTLGAPIMLAGYILIQLTVRLPRNIKSLFHGTKTFFANLPMAVGVLRETLIENLRLSKK